QSSAWGSYRPAIEDDLKAFRSLLDISALVKPFSQRRTRGVLRYLHRIGHFGIPRLGQEITHGINMGKKLASPTFSRSSDPRHCYAECLTAAHIVHIAQQHRWLGKKKLHIAKYLEKENSLDQNLSPAACHHPSTIHI